MIHLTHLSISLGTRSHRGMFGAIVISEIAFFTNDWYLECCWSSISDLVTSQLASQAHRPLDCLSAG